MADAGDVVDDANFVFETENAAILKLTKELAWYESTLPTKSSLRTGLEEPGLTVVQKLWARLIIPSIS